MLFRVIWPVLVYTGFVAPVMADAVPPNILLIVVDDLGSGDLRSFNPAAAVQTPAIDTLAAQGMRFDRFYTDSTCSASRASLLTGQHPARLGFHPVARGIAPEITTLPEWLRAQGYSTHHIGKWHIGELDAAAKPAAQGFDSSFGFLNQWFLQGPDAQGKPQLRVPVYFDPWLENQDGDWRQYHGYLPDILTQAASQQITALAASSQPWFLWYATPLVHGPIHVTPDAGQVGSDDEKYRAMLRHLDSNIAELLDALDKSGQRDRTLVIFLSDNGAPEKRTGSNGRFAGGKAHYSEGAVRTPMVWVDPGRVLPGSLDQRAISIADIFPTLAARIGHPLPFRTDGMDFNRLDNLVTFNQRPFFWMTRGGGSMLSPDRLWRLVETWTFREKNGLEWLRIGDGDVTENVVQRFLQAPLVARMQRDFNVWLDDVSQTVVTEEILPHGSRISGNDFLRTPLKEWDFYLAVAPGEHADGDQVLAEQAGVWRMIYRASEKSLSISMYGHQWNVPFTMPSGCTLLGLNADVYDRYTNTGNDRNPTELLLSVNGRELARTAWQVESLAGVDVSAPTWTGRSASGDSVWQGKRSPAVFFHRANIVGEWPFFIDEKKWQKTLCGKLQ